MHLHIGKDSILNEDTEKHVTAKDFSEFFYHFILNESRLSLTI